MKKTIKTLINYLIKAITHNTTATDIAGAHDINNRTRKFSTAYYSEYCAMMPKYWQYM